MGKSIKGCMGVEIPLSSVYLLFIEHTVVAHVGSGSALKVRKSREIFEALDDILLWLK